MWLSLQMRLITLFVIYLTCLWAPLETLFSAFPQITSWSVEVSAASLQPEPSRFFAGRGSWHLFLPHATGCCSPGTLAKMQKSWSSMHCNLNGLCCKGNHLITSNIRKVRWKSVPFTRFEPLSCGMYSSSVLLIQRPVTCASSLREFIA